MAYGTIETWGAPLSPSVSSAATRWVCSSARSSRVSRDSWVIRVQFLAGWSYAER